MSSITPTSLDEAVNKGYDLINKHTNAQNTPVWVPSGWLGGTKLYLSYSKTGWMVRELNIFQQIGRCFFNAYKDTKTSTIIKQLKEEGKFSNNKLSTRIPEILIKQVFGEEVKGADKNRSPANNTNVTKKSLAFGNNSSTKDSLDNFLGSIVSQDDIKPKINNSLEKINKEIEEINKKAMGEVIDNEVDNGKFNDTLDEIGKLKKKQNILNYLNKVINEAHKGEGGNLATVTRLRNEIAAIGLNPEQGVHLINELLNDGVNKSAEHIEEASQQNLIATSKTNAKSLAFENNPPTKDSIVDNFLKIILSNTPDDIQQKNAIQKEINNSYKEIKDKISIIDEQLFIIEDEEATLKLQEERKQYQKQKNILNYLKEVIKEASDGKLQEGGNSPTVARLRKEITAIDLDSKQEVPVLLKKNFAQ